MKRLIKYGVVSAVILLFILVVTVAVLPVVVNIQKFAPKIETQLSRLTGRPVAIGSNLGLSFLPRLSVSCSDLRIGNPDGFLSDSLLKVETFEARVKILPLFRKEVHISRFIIGGLEVNLEKRSDGQVNWDFTRESRPGEPHASTMSRLAGWTVSENFAMTLFAITDGAVNLIDRTKHAHHRIGDLMLVLKNVTVKEPVAVEFKASVAGHSLAGEGRLGPLGQHPGQGAVPVELAVSLFNSVPGQVKGTLQNLLSDPGYDLQLQVPPFSIRELLLAARSLDDPAGAADPAVGQSMSAGLTAKGNWNQVAIDNGVIKVDDSQFTVSGKVRDFAEPNLDFAVVVDRLDLDRYLAFAVAIGHKQNRPAQEAQAAGKDSGWRKLQLTGAIEAKELKAGGAVLSDLAIQLRGRDGLWAADSATFNLYQGHAQATLSVDWQGDDAPRTSIDMKAQGLQVKPLLHDVFARDFLTGTMEMDVRLLFSGSRAEAVKKSLEADGSLTVRDGVLDGIDLVDATTHLVRQAAGAKTPAEDLRTDFDELNSLFTIRKGLVDSRETTLSSPLTDRLISGTADLITEQLQLLVQAKEGTAMPESLDNDKAVPEGPVSFTISGPFAGPEVHIDGQYPASKGVSPSGAQAIQGPVEDEFPDSGKIVERDLIGKPPIDPAVIARRFGLQYEDVKKDQVKEQPEQRERPEQPKQTKAGTGKIQVIPLRKEEARQ